jgi:hypothetical protein
MHTSVQISYFWNSSMDSNIFVFIYILIYDTQPDLVTILVFKNHQIQKLLDRNAILYIMN